MEKESLKVVIVGHVDHGKSTILGRLLADTGSLPEGKLAQVQESCRRNARPFEYAFLLDALKNEQSQGITIDTARCFFKTAKRRYIMMDAPGHIEFLKNMVTGAATADAALLVIDAHEGIQENSKRHGYLLAMLGVPQVAVVINKFDLSGYDRFVYEQIVKEYSAFLQRLGVKASCYIPASGRHGENIVELSRNTPWYSGPTVLSQLETFTKRGSSEKKPFRMPVQDIYKFTAQGDERRIVAGTIAGGSIAVGDSVVFLPSGKESVVKTFEGFPASPESRVSAPCPLGVTLSTQIYVRPGEIMCRKDEASFPQVADRLHVNLFWLGRAPMVKRKRYKLKIGQARIPVELVELRSVIDATELGTPQNKEQLDRHDIAECVLETTRPIAFDLLKDCEASGRFVLVDEFQIAGGGVILGAVSEGRSALQERIRKREVSWEGGLVSAPERVLRNRHRGKFVLLTGVDLPRIRELARQFERKLFTLHLNAYYLAPASLSQPEQLTNELFEREEQLAHLGSTARILTDAGLIVVTPLSGLDEHEIAKLRLLNTPYELLTVSLDEELLSGGAADLLLSPKWDIEEMLAAMMAILNRQNVIPDYCI